MNHRRNFPLPAQAHRKPTTEDALRRRGPAQAVSSISTNHRLAPTSGPTDPTSRTALYNSTNLPPKRRRLDIQSSSPVPTAKELYAAPDWGGNERDPTQPFGQTPAPFSPSSAPPPSRFPGSSSFITSSNPLSLSHSRWGLRREVVLGFRAAGIEDVYPWQNECLSFPGLLHGVGNLVYTAPTSAGKSLVADILAIKTVVEAKKKAIIVLPFIAIVQEKTRFLKKVLGNVKVEMARKHEQQMRRWRNVNIVGFHSGAKNRVTWRDLDMAVCTIEKANALVNAAIEDRTIDQLGIVVFDELHMLDDDYRGYVLELLATKLLCLSDEQIRIVGMSATIGNLQTLASWLRAHFYECTYRPIPLSEHLVYDNGIYTYSHKLTKRIPESEVKELKDPVTNATVTLTVESVTQSHSVLIFCESRKRCEILALCLTKFMPAADLDLQEKRLDIIRDLATTATGLDFALEKTIAEGVAFHHAGLTTEERDIVSDAYDKGLIKVICCTATMAAGVNLPARRVILSPRMGRDFVKPAMLQQMRGRAGRKGRDTIGESFVCCRTEDLPALSSLLTAEMPTVKSCLAGPDNKHGLTRALLEIIAIRLATSPESIEEYFASTLLYHTYPEPSALPALLTAALSKLQSQDLIENIDGSMAATKIGQATVASGFAPDEGVFLHQVLSRALKNFNLETDMHIVYAFTPTHVSSSQTHLEINWKLFREDIERLDESDLRTAQFVGVSPAFVNKMAFGGKMKEDTPEQIDKARVYRRFYVALMLRELLNEKLVHVVAEEYEVARGFIQSLVTTCRGFATTSAVFCRAMGWTGLAVLLEHYSWRLDLGVKDELMQLAQLPFVKSYTARVFFENGLKTVETVSKASLAEIEKCLEEARPKKVRFKKEEQERLKRRLKERAVVVKGAAERVWRRECEVELDE